MHAEFLAQDRRGSRFISGRSISRAPVFSRNYYVAERRGRRRQGCREERRDGDTRLGDKNKKKVACLFLYLCVVATGVCFRMQEIGRAPQSERNLQTQFPGQTDRRTDERVDARANRGPLAVPTTSIWVHRDRMRL